MRTPPKATRTVGGKLGFVGLAGLPLVGVSAAYATPANAQTPVSAADCENNGDQFVDMLELFIKEGCYNDINVRWAKTKSDAMDRTSYWAENITSSPGGARISRGSEGVKVMVDGAQSPWKVFHRNAGFGSIWRMRANTGSFAITVS